MKISKRVLTLVLAFIMISTIFIGCEKRDQESEPGSSSSSKESSTSSAPKSPDGIASIIPDHTEEVQQRKVENSDSIGWLEVPLVSVDDVVLWSPEDNEYYKRRNFNKTEEFNGVYYADFRIKYTDESYDATEDSLPLNTVIYGHAMTDDNENYELYHIKFGPLHDLRDPDFAADIPYIFFSTEKENYVFEIFANIVINADNGDVPYNEPNMDPEEFYTLIQEEILPRSVLKYDVEIKPDDKFLTLSTCIYHLPGEEDKPPMAYPNYYRYAIMARLVTDLDAPVKEAMTLEVNEDIVIDPPGRMTSAK